MPKPKPKTVKTVCSECGLDWKLHNEKDPTIEQCVILLKAELAKRPKANPYLGYGIGGTGGVTYS